MADVFTPETPVVTTINPLETLVGEGKKFKTVEDLAKSKLESDSFINTLTLETASYKDKISQLEAELAARKSVEDQIKALTPTKVVPQPLPVTPEAAKGQVVITDEDLTKRVQAITDHREQTKIATANIQAVTDHLIATYGSEAKAQEIIKQKAAELKVSTKFLQSTAEQSPDAFFSLIGVAKTPVVTPAAPRTEFVGGFGNRPSTTEPATDTYQGMREKAGRLNVKALTDPRYLNETMQKALENPDKFLSNVA